MCEATVARVRTHALHARLHLRLSACAVQPYREDWFGEHGNEQWVHLTTTTTSAEDLTTAGYALTEAALLATDHSRSPGCEILPRHTDRAGQRLQYDGRVS